MTARITQWANCQAVVACEYTRAVLTTKSMFVSAATSTVEETLKLMKRLAGNVTRVWGPELRK